ncbi:unnamed protein product [Triticum turgidum subsp. durum]|uniref:F-box domain-containing protein n=1 Tax=Triticum turgidum subsp. durum TaxID=4567 RepID=A0A9R0YCP2_TRITD|nr:unnamed protein product [Triticum turgidum subsp. durum]
MSHQAGGDEMALRRRHPSTAAPLEDEDLLGEILLRVLPPMPSSLPRASLVSKLWGGVAAAPSFRRRFVAHHRRPPVLGFFEKRDGKLVFTPILDPPDRIPRARFSLRPGGDGDDFCGPFNSWVLLGCRHGWVLIVIRFRPMLLVFHPVSGDCRSVDIPSDFLQCVRDFSGAVLCAAGDDQGHVHGDCHSCPFKVVLVGTRQKQDLTVAWVYSSETGMWGDQVSTTQPCAGLVYHLPDMVNRLPCTLVGNVLYWLLHGSDNGILEFDLDSQRLAVIERPSSAGINRGNSRIIRLEDGNVGLAVFLYPSFNMWKRKVSSQGVASWVRHKIIDIHKIIGLPRRIKTGKGAIVGYSEDANAVFISVSGYLQYYAFIVQLESMQSRKLNQILLENSYHLFADFYTAGTVPAVQPTQQQSTVPAIEPPQLYGGRMIQLISRIFVCTRVAVESLVVTGSPSILDPVGS